MRSNSCGRSNCEGKAVLSSEHKFNQVDTVQEEEKVRLFFFLLQSIWCGLSSCREFLGAHTGWLREVFENSLMLLFLFSELGPKIELSTR